MSNCGLKKDQNGLVLALFLLFIVMVVAIIAVFLRVKGSTGA